MVSTIIQSFNCAPNSDDWAQSGNVNRLHFDLIKIHFNQLDRAETKYILMPRARKNITNNRNFNNAWKKR